MKKMISQILLLSVLFLLLTGCGNGGNGKAEVARPQEAEKTVSANEWYELDADSGVLTIRLPDEKQGFTWAFTIADESMLELLTHETTEKQYVASFRALAGGKTQVTFSYFRNDELNEVRVIEIRCKDGKVTKVTSDGVVDKQPADGTERA